MQLELMHVHDTRTVLGVLDAGHHMNVRHRVGPSGCADMMRAPHLRLGEGGLGVLKLLLEQAALLHKALLLRHQLLHLQRLHSVHKGR